MRPVLHARKPKTRAAQVGIRIEVACSVDAPSRGVRVGVVDQTKCLSIAAIEVMDIAKGRIADIPEVEVVEEGGAGEEALEEIVLSTTADGRKSDKQH